MNHEKGNHERITSIWAHDEPNKNYMGYFYGVVGAAPPIFLAVKINYSPVCHSHTCMRNRSMLLELGILASFFFNAPNAEAVCDDAQEFPEFSHDFPIEIPKTAGWVLPAPDHPWSNWS
jgi:hypothetical protein